MDGYAVAQALRGNPALSSTPIVALTSYAMAGDREKALAAGCTGYIEKADRPGGLRRPGRAAPPRGEAKERTVSRVLIVDDIAENRYLLETILKAGGLRVVSAVNGAEALAAAQAAPPDLSSPTS
jgi:Response regulator containing CheY-like receiver, AAA-type ATPase, and DNA-binding domains